MVEEKKQTTKKVEEKKTARKSFSKEREIYAGLR